MVLKKTLTFVFGWDLLCADKARKQSRLLER